MDPQGSHDVTLILQSLRQGDEAGLERILPIVYGELQNIARRQMAKEKAGHTLQPTALVHEAYLCLVNASAGHLGEPRPFFRRRGAGNATGPGRSCTPEGPFTARGAKPGGNSARGLEGGRTRALRAGRTVHGAAVLSALATELSARASRAVRSSSRRLLGGAGLRLARLGRPVP